MFEVSDQSFTVSNETKNVEDVELLVHLREEFALERAESWLVHEMSLKLPEFGRWNLRRARPKHNLHWLQHVAKLRDFGFVDDIIIDWKLMLLKQTNNLFKKKIFGLS